MPIEHADGSRQRHPADKEWTCTPQPLNTGVYHYPGTAMALVHAPGVRIPLTHQDWEQVDDEDCWGANYTEPTTQIRGKIETILHIWGEEQPETKQDEITKLIPERERFSVPHASRDPKILQDVNLENKDIFELIKNPPEVGAVRIFEQPEIWDSTIGPTLPMTTEGIATIHLPSGPLSMDGAQWHLLKHTLTNDGSNPHALVKTI